MKNLRRIVGIALVLAIGLTFTTCDNDSTSSSGGDPGGPTFLGDELELSGQVYLEEWGENISYTAYNGNLTISNSYGGSGSVTNGQLTYSITGTPTGLSTLDFGDAEDAGYTNIQISKPSVRGVTLDALSTPSGQLSYTKTTVSWSNTSGSYTFEAVSYVYVEEDVTVSGTGGTENGTDTYDGITVTWTEKANNFSLALKEGWNAVYFKVQDSQTLTSSTTGTETRTVSISLGNPSLRWVLDDGSYSGSILPQGSIAPVLERGGLRKFGSVR